MWIDHSASDERKPSPGAIESVLQHPSDTDKVLTISIVLTQNVTHSIGVVFI